MNIDRPLIEKALPSYEIGVEVGRGAWGVVLSGRHKRLDRKVAIKQLPRAFAADPAVRERFVAEARMAAGLEHPHIVPVYDYVEEDGLALIVMELCPSNLADRFSSDGIATDEACAALLATCAALQYAHERNVLHRDVKPENLLYSEDGVLKLSDFGIARALDASVRLTQTGTVMGTPAYMAPEQAAGDEVSPATDVYSSGVMLYELLAGDLPFAQADSIGALIRQHMFETPRPLAETAPSVPTGIADVVAKALEKDPSDRYPSALDFGVALGEAAAYAFGPGWLRQRRFALSGATELLAATEKDVSGSGRAGTIIVRGHTKAESVEPAPVAATIAPQAAPDAGVTLPPAAVESMAAPAAASPPAKKGLSIAAIGAIAAVAAVVVAVAVFAGGGDADPSAATTATTQAPTATTVAPVTVAPTTTGSSATSAATTTPTTLAPTTTTEQSVTTVAPDVSIPPALAIVPADPGPLVIGSLTDIGDGHQDQALAVQIAVEEINEADGVLGGGVTFLPGEYTDGSQAVIEADRLVADGAAVIVGPSGPEDVEGALGAVRGSGVLVMSATDPFRREVPGDVRYLRTNPPAALAGVAAMNIVSNVDRVVILGDPDPGVAQIEVATAARLALEFVGATVTLVRVDAVDATDVIKAARPEGVLIVARTASPAFYETLFAAGVTVDDAQFVFVGGSGAAPEFDSGELVGTLGVFRKVKAEDGFAERMPGLEPSRFAAQAYDAAIIVALAAEAAGSVDDAAIANAVPAVTSDGVECFSFAECVALVRSGTDIDYEGAGGPYEIAADLGYPTRVPFEVSVLGPAGQVVSVTSVDMLLRIGF